MLKPIIPFRGQGGTDRVLDGMPGSCHCSAHYSELKRSVPADSVGRVYVKRSSLYRLLKDLVNKAYITKQHDGHSGLTYYDLTPKGWHTLEHELPRLEQYVRLLRLRLSPRQYRAALEKV